MPNSATFIAADIATLGNWSGVYGADGYAIAHDTFGPEYPSSYISLPAYASFGATGVGNNLFTFSDPSSDPKSLQNPLSLGTRFFSVWYSNSQLVFDLTISGAAAKSVWIYFDQGGSGRTSDVVVTDGDSGVTLDSRTVTGYSDSVYLGWTVLGHVKFTVNNSSINVLTSGFFFDAGPSTGSLPLLDAGMSGGFREQILAGGMLP